MPPVCLIGDFGIYFESYIPCTADMRSFQFVRLHLLCHSPNDVAHRHFAVAGIDAISVIVVDVVDVDDGDVGGCCRRLFPLL